MADVRAAPTILHLDMDAFFAAVEQACKPSLRGKPVIVGGLGPRGVVSTASYEARIFGARSAMPMVQARRLCPNAAYLGPRFELYRRISDAVMELLGSLSPLVEPLSLDEAFVDLEAGEALPAGSGAGPDAEAVRAVGERLREAIHAGTGLRGSVGLAGSKLLAKIASEQAKPDGLVLIPPGTERELLAPMSVRTLPGIGPATAEALRRAGITTVGETVEAGEAELLRLLGRAHGGSLYAMACGVDDRPVVAERESKSISVEDTFDVDLTDRAQVQSQVARLAEKCVLRLRGAGRSGRTVVVKVRSYDFSTLTRSETLRGPTDDLGVVREAAARLIDAVDTTAGVRLLGVGVSGLADFTQEDLFAQAEAERGGGADEGAEPRGPSGLADSAAVDGAVESADQAASVDSGESAGAVEPAEPVGGAATAPPQHRRWVPGQDVWHVRYGAGWVQGSGIGRVTVRFETPASRPGRVRTFPVDDPELTPAEPLLPEAMTAAAPADERERAGPADWPGSSPTRPGIGSCPGSGQDPGPDGGGVP